jgi:hypothetical protein
MGQSTSYDLWVCKMGQIAGFLKEDNLIKKFDEKEGDIRIKNEDKEIMKITYSSQKDTFYIKLGDNFYREENSHILENILSKIKEINENQEVVVF